MVLKLFGHPMSTCSKRVAVVLKEKNVPFEFIQIKPGEEKTEEYLANRQPFGQIPVLEDGNVVIYESRAIARYVATKYASQGNALIPTNPSDFEELARFETALANEATQFIYAELLCSEAVFKKYHGGTPDPNIVAAYTTALDSKMDAYERILSKRPFLAGNHVTLADLYHLPYIDMINNRMQLDVMTKRPSVARWCNEISSRESWQVVKDGIKV